MSQSICRIKSAKKINEPFRTQTARTDEFLNLSVKVSPISLIRLCRSFSEITVLRFEVRFSIEFLRFHGKWHENQVNSATPFICLSLFENNGSKCLRQRA